VNGEAWITGSPSLKTLEMKKQKRVKDAGGYLVDEKQIGPYNDRTEAVIIDNVLDRERQKPRVKVMRTENLSLLAGTSTVAVFKIVRRHAANIAPILFSENFQ
jgi:hypothetical protein